MRFKTRKPDLMPCLNLLQSSITVCCFQPASLCCRVLGKQEYYKATLGSNTGNISASIVKVLRGPAEAMAGAAPKSQKQCPVTGQVLATAAALQLLSMLLRSELPILTSKEGLQAKTFDASRVQELYATSFFCAGLQQCANARSAHRITNVTLIIM